MPLLQLVRVHHSIYRGNIPFIPFYILPWSSSCFPSSSNFFLPFLYNSFQSFHLDQDIFFSLLVGDQKTSKERNKAKEIRPPTKRSQGNRAIVPLVFSFLKFGQLDATVFPLPKSTTFFYEPQTKKIWKKYANLMQRGNMRSHNRRNDLEESGIFKNKWKYTLKYWFNISPFGRCCWWLTFFLESRSYIDSQQISSL